MLIHIKDFAKVLSAAMANVFAAAAKAATTNAPEQGFLPRQENLFLHDLLTVIQIGVGIVTAAYIGLKLYRLWKNKKATS